MFRGVTLGNRPVWVYGANRGGGFNIYARGTRLGNPFDRRSGEADPQQRIVGYGTCGGYATANNVGDQGYTN
jgi:hypothetical protein